MEVEEYHKESEALVITMGKNFLQVDAYILDLGGIDMMLGVEWLETLGVVKSDWKKKP